jgi:hypothetical protein
MPDPNPFLSTVAAVSATLVAIIGGLLVARFVTITSEQESGQQLIDDAQGRLATAREREKVANDTFVDWEINNFFENAVISDICDGERDIEALRDRARSYTNLTDHELTEVVQNIAHEFDAAKSLLRPLVVSVEGGDEPSSWDEFRKSIPTKIETNWELVWELSYEEVFRSPGSRMHTVLRARRQLPFSVVPTPPEYVKLKEERRDAMRAEIQRRRQQVEDIDGEVARLERSHRAIVRPKGLGWGWWYSPTSPLSASLFRCGL